MSKVSRDDQLDPLPWPSSEHHAALTGGGNAGAHALTQQIVLEFCERGHQRDHLRRQGIEPGTDDLADLSPLGWEHINLTGDYQWEAEESMSPEQFRPLRTRSGDLAMAA